MNASNPTFAPPTLLHTLQEHLHSLQDEHAALRQSLGGLEWRLVEKRGRAVRQGLGALAAPLQAVERLPEAVRARAAAALQGVAAEQERLLGELTALRDEAAHVLQQLDAATAAAGVRATQHTAQVAALCEASEVEKQRLSNALTRAPAGEALAARRQRGYRVRQQADQAVEALVTALQEVCDAERLALRPAQQAARSARLALRPVQRQGATLQRLARADRADPLIQALLGDLLTAPRVAFAPLATTTRWERRGFGAAPMQPARAGLVAAPLLALLLSAAVVTSRGERPAAPAPTLRATREQALARITQRHLLAELQRAATLLHATPILAQPVGGQEAVQTTRKNRATVPTMRVSSFQEPVASPEQEARMAAAEARRVRPTAPPPPSPAAPPTGGPTPPAVSGFTPARYTMQPGDTLASVAGLTGIQVETLVAANEGITQDGNPAPVGATLIVPPLDGTLHTVQGDETVAAIAARYGVGVDALVSFEGNHLAAPDMALVPGQTLLVPTPLATRFGWPAQGPVSQNAHAAHMALDIAAPLGSPVAASGEGQIILAGWNTEGYGNLVVVEHAEGFHSLYGHLATFAVQVGDVVTQGQPLGTVGSTGNSTGPHLHFEIRLHGVHQDPRAFLR